METNKRKQQIEKKPNLSKLCQIKSFLIVFFVSVLLSVYVCVSLYVCRGQLIFLWLHETPTKMAL